MRIGSCRIFVFRHLGFRHLCDMTVTRNREKKKIIRAHFQFLTTLSHSLWKIYSSRRRRYRFNKTLDARHIKASWLWIQIWEIYGRIPRLNSKTKTGCWNNHISNARKRKRKKHLRISSLVDFGKLKENI